MRDAEYWHLPADSDGFTIDRQHQLDLTEALRQGVLMARGLTPLCRPDCAGLCPSCGINRNDDRCDCAPPPPDPRWAALDDLKGLLAADVHYERPLQ